MPFYEETADLLRPWRNRQTELVALLGRLRTEGLSVPELEDRGKDGSRFTLQEIDPFTVFALFNRGLSDDNRRRLAAALGRELGVKSPPPGDFTGIPVVNNQKTWFFAYASDRTADDVPALWTVFEKALDPKSLDDPTFAESFDAALRVKGVRFNLTMGLFCVRPLTFLSLDGVLQTHAQLSVSATRLNARTYIETVREVGKRGVPFQQLSYDAWLASRTVPVSETADNSIPDEAVTDPGDVPVFWFVGAYWDGDDQTKRFLAEEIWENGYNDRFLDEVKSMRPGEKIAIKASFTRKRDLPFESSGKAASVMTIKAIGTILSNLGDGKRVRVAWQKPFEPPRNWYFYTNRQTVWGVRRGKKPYNDYLIDFTFFGRDQDYEWFLASPTGPDGLARIADRGSLLRNLRSGSRRRLPGRYNLFLLTA